jgi:RNA polymerase sigma-70 factor, ECF subfamily
MSDDLDVSELMPESRGVASERGRNSADRAMDRYAAGNEAAFAEVYDALAPRLYGYLLRQTRDPERAEDLLQQTMLQIHAMRGRFFPGAEVLPWAFAIARRMLINSYRRRRREANVLEGQIVAEYLAAPTTEDVVHSRRLAQSLERELSKLPETQRLAFELMKKEGLSLREVAEVLGTTVTAVKLRAHRAYVTLRAAMAKEALGDAD